MNELQTTKIAIAIAPAAIVDNAAFPSNVIDTQDFQGADYIEFVCTLGATDIALTTLKVMESDIKTDATTLGGVPALVVDTAAKPGATDDNSVLVIGVNLKNKRSRYLQLQATIGNGTLGGFFTALAVGRRTHNASSNAADRGLLSADYG
jgi:hypothetical protein